MCYDLGLVRGKVVARAFVLVLMLALFWAGLSGYVQLLLVGSGAVSIVAALWFVRRAHLEIEDWGARHFVRAAITYLPWLLWQVVLANLRVIRIVWSPSLPIAPRVFEAPCDLKTASGRAVYANSITMTPGTLPLAVGDVVIVHALTEPDAAGVLDGEMLAPVRRLEPGGAA